MHGRTMAATPVTVIFVIVIVDVDERDFLVSQSLCLEPDDGHCGWCRRSSKHI